MARIFNIYFSYNGIMHNAIISVRTTPFFTEYKLNNFNEELLKLLPGNTILFREPDNFIFQNASAENSPALMKAIIQAVSEHLHMKQV
jgi:hypothetical protein